jgi:hypothetical protein
VIFDYQVLTDTIHNMKPMNYLLTQLGQSSTWRGILMVLTAVGVSLNPQHQEAIVAAGLGLVGAINILRKG